MASTEYSAGKPIGGRIRTTTVQAAAGTYYTGQVLGRTDATGVYGDYDSGGAGGLENIKAVCWEDDEKTLATAGAIVVATITSELYAPRLVDGSNDAITLTDLQIENARDNGLTIRR